MNNWFDKVLYDKTCFDATTVGGRFLRVIAVTSQYRLIRAITAQYRLIKTITAQYRKIISHTAGGGQL